MATSHDSTRAPLDLSPETLSAAPSLPLAEIAARAERVHAEAAGWADVERRVAHAVERAGIAELAQETRAEHEAWRLESRPIVTVDGIAPETRRRRRVRSVDDQDLAEHTRRRALATGKWVITVRVGGSVANAYRYPATTEVALAACDPLGRCVVWVGERPANKVTSAGASECLVPGSRWLWDGRAPSGGTLEESAREAIKAEHRATVGVRRRRTQKEVA